VELYLVRHGETEWSRMRRHTSRTDVPLSPAGELEAKAFGAHLRGLEVDRVLSSPMQRARETARLAGFGDRLETTPALLEFDYGDYEGLTSAQIRATRPDWDLFRDGCPGGETVEAAAGRARSLLADLTGDPARVPGGPGRESEGAGRETGSPGEGTGGPGRETQGPGRVTGGRFLLFGHGHQLRILTACYLGLPPDTARHLFLGTASLSVLGIEHYWPVILLWNEQEGSGARIAESGTTGWRGVPKDAPGGAPRGTPSGAPSGTPRDAR
jgi:broad specificity phosphatase PhoE